MSKVTPETLVTAGEAAQLLGCHSRTIRRLVHDGRLEPAGKVPGKTGAYMFRLADILELKASA